MAPLELDAEDDCVGAGAGAATTHCSPKRTAPARAYMVLLGIGVGGSDGRTELPKSMFSSPWCNAVGRGCRRIDGEIRVYVLFTYRAVSEHLPSSKLCSSLQIVRRQTALVLWCSGWVTLMQEPCIGDSDRVYWRALPHFDQARSSNDQQVRSSTCLNPSRRAVSRKQPLSANTVQYCCSLDNGSVAPFSILHR